MEVLEGWSAFQGDEAVVAYPLKQEAAVVLPLFPADSLVMAINGLSNAELAMALRHKLVALARTPTDTLYGAATNHGRDHAAAHGLRLAADIDPRDLQDAIFECRGQSLLHRAVTRLASAQPAASARRRLNLRQGSVFVVLAVLAAVAYWRLETGTVYLLFSFCSCLFFTSLVALRILCLLPTGAARQRRAAPLAATDLPPYSVFVPLFRETAVLGQLITALSALRYPIGKLDIKLILEENDQRMIEAVARLDLPDHFDIIIVPQGQPQTKPRALAFAMGFARGSLLTIYDGEDIPERDQLLRAASYFAEAGPELACLQARLVCYNPKENWLARQFTAEYAALFSVILPGLAENALPLPLGGTSNHFRVKALEAVGGWDPFNVTEDADLGYRLASAGYRTGVLDSTTYEEASTEYSNWMKQRRRWLKGFLQTWLVHMRRPSHLWRALGWDGFWSFQAMTLGVFLSALLHPFMLAHTVWFFASGAALEQAQEIFHALAVGISIAILLAGYGVGIASAAVGLRRSGIIGFTGTLATIPLYWLLMCPAAWAALWDFLVRPHHWHKTRHGLSAFQQRARRATRPSSP